MYNDSFLTPPTKEEVRDENIKTLSDCALRIEKKMDTIIELLVRMNRKEDEKNRSPEDVYRGYSKEDAFYDRLLSAWRNEVSSELRDDRN